MSRDVDHPGARDVTFNDVRLAYRDQARGLLDGGSDLLLVETVFDTLNAKAALFAIEEIFEERGSRVPVLLSVTITDQSGRTLSGQTIEAFWNSVSHFPLFSVGINCALGAAQMRPFMEELARIASVRTSCYPNAGLPNAFGGFDETPETHGGGHDRLRQGRVAQSRGRVLRHHPRSHQSAPAVERRGEPASAAREAFRSFDFPVLKR